MGVGGGLGEERPPLKVQKPLPPLVDPLCSIVPPLAAEGARKFEYLPEKGKILTLDPSLWNLFFLSVFPPLSPPWQFFWSPPCRVKWCSPPWLRAAVPPPPLTPDPTPTYVYKSNLYALGGGGARGSTAQNVIFSVMESGPDRPVRVFGQPDQDKSQPVLSLVFLEEGIYPSAADPTIRLTGNRDGSARLARNLQNPTRRGLAHTSQPWTRLD